MWDDSLVDPDNRRPVDFAARREELKALTHPKIRVVTAALHLRREKPDVFDRWRLRRPLLADGPASAHVAAFARGSEVVIAVTRHSVRLAESGWGETRLALPDGTWHNRLRRGAFSGPISPADLFAELPVALLERVE